MPVALFRCLASDGAVAFQGFADGTELAFGIGIAVAHAGL
jgi:hypothetical protein